MQDLTKFLSTAPVLSIVWLALTATILIVFNYMFPDLLFHPMP